MSTPSPSDPPDTADHAWLVEEREYARHEARRGRRHAFEHLDPRRTALVVVDLVPFFVRESAYVRGIVPRVERFASDVRSAGGVVAWVVPGYASPERQGPRVLRRRGGRALRPVRRRRSSEVAVDPSLDVAPDDLVVEKTARSAYSPGSSDLPALLAARDVDTLVVTGTVTNVCVEDTVRDASAAGLRVILVADGCAAVRDQDHNATLHVVHRSYGDVRPTVEVLDLLRRALGRLRTDDVRREDLPADPGG